MDVFRADPAQLSVNATAAAEHAAALREWIDDFDNPAHYERLQASVGVIAYPVIAALRRHGSELRRRVNALIASYEYTATASQTGAAAITGTDEAAAAGVQSTVEGHN